MDIQHYRARINYREKLQVTFQCLEKLQQQHLMHIPFEGIDIYYGIPVSLDKEDIYRKIIGNNRGGYCYELNSLFYYLLQAVGFDVSIISGRLANGSIYGPEYDHMALLVKLHGKEYLVDVGFGDFSLKPLSINYGGIQHDGRCGYRITKNKPVDGANYFSVDKWNEKRGIFATEYIFTTNSRQPADFLAMHHNKQHDSQSYFVRNLVCTMPVEHGRLSLVNNRFIKTIKGEKKLVSIGDDDMKAYLMKKYFDVNFAIPQISKWEDFLKRA